MQLLATDAPVLKYLVKDIYSCSNENTGGPNSPAIASPLIILGVRNRQEFSTSSSSSSSSSSSDSNENSIANGESTPVSKKAKSTK